MSAATKRKHVYLEIQAGDFKLPQPNQSIVEVLHCRGNNLLEVRTADQSTFLVSMPNKYRNKVWVKRKDYILVEPIEEGDKVKAEMVAPLNADFIKFLKKENVWPDAFKDKEDSSENTDLIFENTNRPPTLRRDSSSDSEEEMSDEE